MKKATRSQSKKHNTHLILRTIYQNEGVSRADIARSTRLTRPTVSSIVSELLEQQLVQEAGLGPSAGGKPPTLLEIAGDAHQLLCVDLGSRDFRGAVVNLRGDIVDRYEVPAPSGSDDALAHLHQLTDELVARATQPILGLGVGTPGLVDPATGTVLHAVNLGWHNLPLKKQLAARYEVPVYVANDSHMAALAEYSYGEPLATRHLILVKIGQGVGAGIVLDGRIFSGDGFGAGEIGHLVVQEGGPPCRCGNAGCLETITSTRALVAEATSIGLVPAEYSMDQAWASLVRALEQGDPLAERLVANAGHHLGVALASLIAAFDVQQVVVAGRVSQLGESLLAAARTTARQRALPDMVQQAELRYSTLGTDRVILGCSAMVLSHELGVI